MTEPLKAIAILIDNSDTSLNADFFPNRLEAQKIAAMQLASYQLSTNDKTQIAIFTCGSKEFGIRISFTSQQSKINNSLGNIKKGGDLKLFSTIQQAIVSFHFSEPVQQRRILCFVGAPNDIGEREAKIIAEKCIKEKVDLNFVIFGENVPNRDILYSLSKNTSKNALCIELKENTVLCDAILNSDFGPGEENSRVSIDDISSILPEIGCVFKHVIQNQQQAYPMKDKELERKGKQKRKKGGQ